MATATQIITKEHIDTLLTNYDNFLFDCDGVVWLDDALIPGMLDTINYLVSKDKRVSFITNNSSKSRNEYIHKFKKLGFKDVDKDTIYPTCYAAALHLKHHMNVPEGSKVWVLGDHGIEEELKELGYVPIGGTDPRLDEEFHHTHDLLKVDRDVKAVVVGSTKQFNYMRIATTLQYLLHENKSVPFIGTNIDRSFPGPEGLILPAGGSVVNYMEYTAHRDCVNVGKPSSVLLQTVLESQGFDKERTLMVGDTLYTDIKFGNDGELGGENGSSLLVLSGGTKLGDLDRIDDESTVPSYVMKSFGDLIDLVN